MNSRERGWYPDPLNPGQQIYWDGATWGEPVGVPDDSDKSKKIAIAIGVCILAVVGVVMSMQSVSLFSGSGTVWTGVAVAGVAAAASFFLGADNWVRVTASLLLVVALISGFDTEMQMNDKRNEIYQILDN